MFDNSAACGLCTTALISKCYVARIKTWNLGTHVWSKFRNNQGAMDDVFVYAFQCARNRPIGFP